MSIIDNPVFGEIRATIDSGPKPVNFSWEAVIHANGQKIKPLRVLRVNIDRDYVDNYSDLITIEMQILDGDYKYDVHPYKEELELTLTRTPVTENAGEKIEGRDPISQRFRAVLSDPRDELIDAPNASMTDKESSNVKNIKLLQMQLIDLPLEQIRLMSVGDIYRNVRTVDVARFLMAEQSRKADVPESEGVIGVDVAPGASKRVWKHVIIPHRTPLVDLPHYLQKQAGGIYTAGLNSYLQHRVWYLYPPFNIQRYENAINLLTVLNVPSNLLPGLERTYRIKGNQVFIISTGDTINRDTSEERQQNEGNGISYANADKLLEEFGSVSGNRVTASRKENNVELMINRRKTGLNNIKMSPLRITNNHPAEISRLAPRNGQYIQFTWENANSRLIQPGMPVRFLTTRSEKLVEYYGTVISAEYFIEWKGASIADGLYVTTAAVTLFVQREGKVIE